jgi:hypothetical protein
MAMDFTSAKPKPTLPERSLAPGNLKKGSKIFSRNAKGTPGPLSHTFKITSVVSWLRRPAERLLGLASRHNAAHSQKVSDQPSQQFGNALRFHLQQSWLNFQHSTPRAHFLGTQAHHIDALNGAHVRFLRI